MLVVCVHIAAFMLRGSVNMPKLAVNKTILCIGNNLVWHYSEKHGKLVNAEVGSIAVAASGNLLLIPKLLYLCLACVSLHISVSVEQIYSN